MSDVRLQQFAATSLLTPAQEIHLSKLVQAGLAPDATPRQKKAAERARAKFILSNTRLVMQVANRYTKRCKQLEFDDLFTEGCIGLNSAVTKFDHTKGYKFSTYAYWWIRQAITRAINTTDRTIRLPQHVHEKIAYAKRHGVITENDRLQIETAMATANMISLNTLCSKAEDSSELIEFIPQEDNELDFSFMDELGIDEDYLQTLMRCCLNPNEYFVLCMRYGLGSQNETTFDSIGSLLNVTRERVRQIQFNAYRKLRQALTLNGIRP